MAVLHVPDLSDAAFAELTVRAARLSTTDVLAGTESGHGPEPREYDSQYDYEAGHRHHP